MKIELTFFMRLVFSFIFSIVIYFLVQQFDLSMSASSRDNYTELSFSKKLYIASTTSAITVIIGLLIGLPIRLIKPINLWWKQNNYISIFLIVMGVLMVLSILLQGVMEDFLSVKYEWVSLISVFGWYITAFGILHFYPSKE